MWAQIGFHEQQHAHLQPLPVFFVHSCRVLAAHARAIKETIYILCHILVTSFGARKPTWLPICTELWQSWTSSRKRLYRAIYVYTYIVTLWGIALRQSANAKQSTDYCLNYEQSQHTSYSDFSTFSLYTCKLHIGDECPKTGLVLLALCTCI